MLETIKNKFEIIFNFRFNIIKLFMEFYLIFTEIFLIKKILKN